MLEQKIKKESLGVLPPRIGLIGIFDFKNLSRDEVDF